ncbi:MAG: ABC transporter permease, partial [Phycisphaeraceae bacterium]|nr:ABC transporter permease [Phycisphaeraceae bacterium]
ANSILQGSLVVSKTRFEMMFPSEPGYRAFLIDCPTDRVDEVSATLTRALEDVGLSLERTGDRLARFNTVQNTYLTIFQALGGLGVVLGSFGLGAVVLRNVLERRRELATLVAVGFTRGKVRGLVIAEHAGLLAGGLLVGALSAAAAVLPVAPQDAGASMWLATGLTLGGVALAGGLWVVGASLAATGGNIIQMLRRK